jgi:hypothetical protein
MRRLARHVLPLPPTQTYGVDDGLRPQHRANSRLSSAATTSSTTAVHLEPGASR